MFDQTLLTRSTGFLDVVEVLVDVPAIRSRFEELSHCGRVVNTEVGYSSIVISHQDDKNLAARHLRRCKERFVLIRHLVATTLVCVLSQPWRWLARFAKTIRFVP